MKYANTYNKIELDIFFGGEEVNYNLFTTSLGYRVGGQSPNMCEWGLVSFPLSLFSSNN